jgi:hypothetical protein
MLAAEGRLPVPGCRVPAWPEQRVTNANLQVLGGVLQVQLFFISVTSVFLAMSCECPQPQ